MGSVNYKCGGNCELDATWSSGANPITSCSWQTWRLLPRLNLTLPLQNGLFPMLKTLLLDSFVDKIMLSGRWVRGLNGSLSASWASSSLSFVFSGTILEILPGALTERKDQWNGGIPMIAIWTGKDENSITSNQPPWKVCDVEAGSGVILVQTMATSETYVRIMMIDWASVFEIGALLVDEV